jgi:putative hydrolase of the HAD superfamily
MMKATDLTKLSAIFQTPELRLIAIDADDTLWYDSRYFRLVEDLLIKLCEPHGIDKKVVFEMLEETRRNYPAGENGFAGALKEVASKVSLRATEISQLQRGLDYFLTHRIEVLPGVRETLAMLLRFRKVVITKGHKEEQKKKLRVSGLLEFLNDVIILNKKGGPQLTNALKTQGATGADSLVIGNSLQHDILPAIEVGASAIWLNHTENFKGNNATLSKEICEVKGWDEIKMVLNHIDISESI